MAKCDVGKYHQIEVEDEALLIGEYENGATLLFHTSTGEFPAPIVWRLQGIGVRL